MGRCLLLSLVCLAGCTPRTPPAGPSGSGYLFVEGTLAQFVQRDGRVAAVVWTDFRGTACDVTGTGGVHDAGDGRRVEWGYSDGGVVTIAGREYPTTAGRVFLVRTAGGRVEVRQLDRDPGSGAGSIAALATSDGDIREFVAAAGRPGK